MEATILRLPIAPPLSVVARTSEPAAAGEPVTAMLFASSERQHEFASFPVLGGRLEAAIAAAFDLADVIPGSEAAREVAEVARCLRRDGTCAFDGGWMRLVTSLPAAADFLMGKVREIEAERSYEDRARAEALSTARAWEARYRHLALVVREAFEGREAQLTAALGAAFGADKITVMEG